LVKIWILLFYLLFANNCLADNQAKVAVYSDYCALLQVYGLYLEDIGIFLENNTKNIIDSSSEDNYIEQLMSLEKEADAIIASMSTIKVPEDLLLYHDLVKKALEHYRNMLILLSKSSKASGKDEKKEFLDEATAEAVKGKELSSKSEIIKPDIDQLLQKYIWRKN